MSKSLQETQTSTDDRALTRAGYNVALTRALELLVIARNSASRLGERFCAETIQEEIDRLAKLHI